MFWVMILYALFASVFIISKTGLDNGEPLFFIGTRMLLAGTILLAYQWYTAPESFKMKKLPWKRLSALGLFNIYLTNAFEFWGLQHLTSFKTCFIYGLSPFISALISYFVFSEKMNLKKWTGLVIGFAGFIPILLSQTAEEELAGQFLLFSWAELSVMMAAICAVYGWILLRQLVKDEGCTPALANGYSMFIGGFCALVHSGLTERWNPIPVHGSLTVFIECALLLVAISSLICYNLYGSLLKRYSATFMSFAGLTTPLFTALFGWLYLGESVSWHFYLSTVIVSSGLFLFYQEELKKDFYPSPNTPLATQGDS